MPRSLRGMMKKLSPVLVVDQIEPVLPLWDALGFSRTAEVPHDNRLGFVILQNGPVEVMYQSVDSVRADLPRALDRPFGLAAVFIEVENLDAIAARVPGTTDVIEQRRKTFYGSTEMIVRDAAGHMITFAQMA